MPAADTGTRAPDGTMRPPVVDFRSIAELRDINFDFDKYDIRTGDAQVLDANAAWLNRNGDQLLLIEGH